jgi:hypothetical protein
LYRSLALLLLGIPRSIAPSGGIRIGELDCILFARSFVPRPLNFMSPSAFSTTEDDESESSDFFLQLLDPVFLVAVGGARLK